jgi:hypothetical protein
MRAVTLLLGSALLLASAVTAGERVEVGVALRFESGSAVLTADSEAALADVARQVQSALQGGRFTRLRIEGHTDSAGADDANLQLSQRRAEAVASALAARGVSLSRLEPVGFGETRPVADERVAGGREKNRRVELVLLAADEVDRTIATVARVHHKVGRRPPQVSDWTPARVQDPLFEAWRVGTEPRSAADISFTQDRADLHVRENTVVVIFGPGELMTATGGRLLGKASLERGTLKSRLAELAGTGDAGTVEVATTSAVAAVAGADVLVGVDAGGTTRVAHHGGQKATVRSTKPKAAPAVPLEAGFGTKVAPGREPTPPSPLPPPPSSIAAASPDGTFVVGDDGQGTVAVRWEPRPEDAGYHIELWRDDDVIADIVDVAAPASSFTAQGLPPGRYGLRIAAVDVGGFEGLPSAPVGLTVTSSPPSPAPTTPAPTTTPPATTPPTTTPPPRTLRDEAPVPPLPSSSSSSSTAMGCDARWSLVPLGLAMTAGGAAAIVAVSDVEGDHHGAVIALAGVGLSAGIVGTAFAVECLRAP